LVWDLLGRDPGDKGGSGRLCRFWSMIRFLDDLAATGDMTKRPVLVARPTIPAAVPDGCV